MPKGLFRLQTLRKPSDNLFYIATASSWALSQYLSNNAF